MDTPADVLGVRPDADEGEVEAAYRRRVMETHPDRGGSAADFQRVRAAYEALLTADPDAVDDPPPAGAGGGSDAPAAAPTATVEYLDYEAVRGRGWDPEDATVFERAAAADLDPAAHGKVDVRPGESLLAAAEREGHTWPYACRGGACANCAVVVVDGDLRMPANHVLPGGMVDGGVRLSCVGTPSSASTRVLYNVAHRPDLDDLRLPPDRFNVDRG